MRDRKLYNKLQQQVAEYNKKALEWCFNRQVKGFAMIHPTLDKVVIFDTTEDGKISLKDLK